MDEARSGTIAAPSTVHFRSRNHPIAVSDYRTELAECVCVLETTAESTRRRNAAPLTASMRPTACLLPAPHTACLLYNQLAQLPTVAGTLPSGGGGPGAVNGISVHEEERDTTPRQRDGTDARCCGPPCGSAPATRKRCPAVSAGPRGLGALVGSGRAFHRTSGPRQRAVSGLRLTGPITDGDALLPHGRILRLNHRTILVSLVMRHSRHLSTCRAPAIGHRRGRWPSYAPRPFPRCLSALTAVLHMTVPLRASPRQLAPRRVPTAPRVLLLMAASAHRSVSYSHHPSCSHHPASRSAHDSGRQAASSRGCLEQPYRALRHRFESEGTGDPAVRRDRRCQVLAAPSAPAGRRVKATRPPTRQAQKYGPKTHRVRLQAPKRLNGPPPGMKPGLPMTAAAPAAGSPLPTLCPVGPGGR